MRSRTRLLPILLTTLTALPAACSGDDASEPEPAPTASVSVVDLAGVEAALEQRRGSGLLLNFWAIWCKPCVAELPELSEIANEYRDRGGEVLTVSYDLMVPDDSPETVPGRVREFLTRHGYRFPVFVYDADDYDAINERFQLPGPIPVTLAIDAEGRIVDRHESAAGADRFREMMERALAP